MTGDGFALVDHLSFLAGPNPTRRTFLVALSAAIAGACSIEPGSGGSPEPLLSVPRPASLVSTTLRPPSQPLAPGWSVAKIGGGGFVTGIDVAADGTKVFRTDTSGAYLFDDGSGSFRQLLPSNLAPPRGNGCFEILVADSDSSVLWALFDGDIMRSDDRGATWIAVRSGLEFGANRGKMRLRGNHGDVDPANPQHFIVADQKGLYRTVDGGANWSVLSEGTTGALAPAGLGDNDDVPGYSGLVFNPYSQVDDDGLTTEVIGATGGRYLRSLDAGATWTDITTDAVAGTSPQQAFFLPTGEYVVAAGPSTGRDGVYTFADESWVVRRESFKPLLVVDPANPRRWALSREADHAYALTDDCGASWVGDARDRTSLRSVDGIGWHDVDEGYLANAAAVDPISARVWFAGGNEGVASVPVSELFERAEDEEQLVLATHGVGLEGLCVNVLLAPPGSSRLHVAAWDETYGQLDRENRHYPEVMGADTLRNGFGASWGLDHSTENPQALAVLASWDNDDFRRSGVSLDDGRTWEPFGSIPVGRAARSASLAYGTLDNLVLVGGANQGVYYTTNRGDTWHPVSVGGVTYEAGGEFGAVHDSQFLCRRVVCADAEVPGVFYWLNTDRVTTDNRGLQRTSDGGASWELVHHGLPTDGAAGLWHFNVKVMSPVTGHVWMTAGGQGGDGPGEEGFFRSFDRGVTLEALPHMLEVASFGFGAPANGGDYPVCFVEGYLDGVYGVHISTDADAPSPRWVTVNEGFPLGRSHGCRDIAGDPDVPGRMWSARACAGVLVGEFADWLI